MGVLKSRTIGHLHQSLAQVLEFWREINDRSSIVSAGKAAKIPHNLVNGPIILYPARFLGLP